MDNLEDSYEKLPHIVLDQPFDRSKIWLINQRTKLITHQITVSKEVPIGNHNAWHPITSVTHVVEPPCSDTINPFLIPKPLYHMKAVWWSYNHTHNEHHSYWICLHHSVPFHPIGNTPHPAQHHPHHCCRINWPNSHHFPLHMACLPTPLSKSLWKQIQ